jgi:hypothetical protein
MKIDVAAVDISILLILKQENLKGERKDAPKDYLA